MGSTNLQASSPLLEQLNSVQARIKRHRMALKESEKGSGGRPRIKGRFGKQGEQLRDWLGEYLIAKYDQIVQEDRAKKKYRYVTVVSVPLRS